MAQGGIRARLEKRIAGTIRRARRDTTILFTDIEGSTRYWDSQGDIRGRLAVDLHNRLVFPVVKRCRGRVIKTIGDSVMATFRDPEDGVRAAIGIQQALAGERERNPDFPIQVRIGLHAGQALVERGDVYGNAVNTAARVESCAAGGEVLLSGATYKQLARGAKQRYAIERGQRLTPRGQSRPMTLYRVAWHELENLVGDIDPNNWMMPREKWQMAGYALVTLAGLWALYSLHGRYLLLDRELVARLVLSPMQLLTQPPVVVALVALAISLGLLLARLQGRPHGSLRLLRGSFGFSILFMLAQLAITLWPAAWEPERYWAEPIYESNHLFVEILEDTVARQAPDPEAAVLREVDTGTLFLLNDVRQGETLTWNRVLIGEDDHGWVARVLPPRLGVPETRISLTDKYYVRWHHLYALGAGLIGLLWGLAGLRLRPV